MFKNRIDRGRFTDGNYTVDNTAFSASNLRSLADAPKSQNISLNKTYEEEGEGGVVSKIVDAIKKAISYFG